MTKTAKISYETLFATHPARPEPPKSKYKL